MTLRTMVTLIFVLLGQPALAYDCGEHADEAIWGGRAAAAAKLYRVDADDERCAETRADLLLDAAYAAQVDALDKSPVERCAVAADFQRALDAGLPSHRIDEARAQRDRERSYCPADSAPTEPTPEAIPIVPLESTLPGSTPDAIDMGEAPHPAFSTTTVPEADTYPLWFAFAGVALSSSAVAYFVLLEADADRAAARREYAAAPPGAAQFETRSRYRDANDTAAWAGWTATGLLAAAAGLGAVGVYELVSDGPTPAGEHVAAKHQPVTGILSW